MDLPLGTPLREGLKTGESDLLQIINNMNEKAFSGYIICTLENQKGMEQGILLFKKGAIAGSYYEFTTHGVQVSGDSAVRLVFNSFLASKGIIDINSLTTQQIDLITAFQEKILISEKIDARKLEKIFPKAFNPQMIFQYVKPEQDETTRFEIFKRTGLVGVEEK